MNLFIFFVGFTAGALAAFLAAALISWWSKPDPITYVNEDTEQ